MNGKQLKNSILQWAIQGKLVPQDPNDEPASVLLERIRAEKKRLIKEGKIKKNKNESIIYRGDDNSYYEKFADGTVKCIDEEIPFEIPQGWEWTRMKDVMTFVNGRAYKKEELLEKGKYRVLRVGNFFTNDAWYYSDLELPEDKYCDNGDLLYAWSASFGPQIWQGGKTIFHYHIWNIQYSQSNLNREYLYFFLEYDKTQIKKATTGSTMVHISMENMNLRLIPIPPFSEQRRIIDKLISILPIVRKYEMSQYTLDALNKSIKNRLRKAILQEAIQGHLVAQDCDDEPTSLLIDRVRIEKQKMLKEGKLKKNDIVDSVIFKGEDNKYYEKVDGKVLDINEEIPFDIPESWSWVRLQQICTYIHRGKSPKYSEVKKFPVVAQKCNQWDGFHIEKAQFIAPESVSSYADENLLQDKDLLWNSTGLGTLGRIGLYPESSNPYGFAVADSHVTVIRTLPKFIRPEYLLLYFSSPTVQSVIEDKASGSTKQKELATETVKSYIVPIPPLSEQDRILDKYKTVLASWS